MKSKIFKSKPNAVVWHRFCRHSYAVFNSLHKVVNVGVISVVIVANSVDAKAKTVHDSDTQVLRNTTLDDIEVVTENTSSLLNENGQLTSSINVQQIQTTPAHAVNDVLKQLPNIDVRQRGGFGLQTDLSVRGASCDQTTILLNGVDISSPQTGHYSADFPFSVNAISKIELAEGSNGSAGTINVVVSPDTFNHVNLQASTGFAGLIDGNVVANLKSKHTFHKMNASASRCDGSVDNSDFKQVQAFYIGKVDISKLIIEYQGGFSGKSFGANSFYSPAYPNQFDATHKILASARFETKTPVHFNGIVSWHRNYDNFQLIRDSSFGENFHRVDVLNFSPDWSYRWKGGKTNVKFDYRHEDIISSNLGIPMENDSIAVFNHKGKFYDKQKKRDILRATIQHNLLFSKWNLNMALTFAKNFDDDAKVQVLPSVNSQVVINKHWKLYASWNKSLRFPTFTELFYKSPTQEGNKDLQPEKLNTWSINTHYSSTFLEATISGYFTHGKDMIDWVMFNADDVFHSSNYKLNNFGVETDATLYFNHLFDCIPMSLSLGYHFIHQNREDDETIFKSYYALEYLKHKFTTSFNIEIIKNLNATLSYRFQARNGGYIVYVNNVNTKTLHDYDPYGILDFKISYDWKRVGLFGELNNILNTEYFDFGNVPQPGILGKIGIKVKLL